jgi:signal transduction histidine kinase
MHNSHSIEFRALLVQQQSLQQQQRKRLARKIHDQVSQKLTLLSLQLSLALLDQKPPANWAQKCKDWNTTALELGAILREITGELRPRILDDNGLVDALEWFSNSCPKGICCQFARPNAEVTLPAAASNEVFALCREIVTDFFAPSGVTQIRIELEETNHWLRLRLVVLVTKADSLPIAVHGLDPLFMQDRLTCVDGNAEVDAQPGKGFSVTLCVRNEPQFASMAQVASP